MSIPHRNVKLMASFIQIQNYIASVHVLCCYRHTTRYLLDIWYSCKQRYMKKIRGPWDLKIFTKYIVCINGHTLALLVPLFMEELYYTPRLQTNHQQWANSQHIYRSISWNGLWMEIYIKISVYYKQFIPQNYVLIIWSKNNRNLACVIYTLSG